MGGDTLTSVDAESDWTLEVIDKSIGTYELEIQSKSASIGDINFSGITENDELAPVAIFIKGMVDVVSKSLEGLEVVYIIDKDGEAVEIKNYDEVFKSFKDATIQNLRHFEKKVQELTGDTASMPFNEEQLYSQLDAKKPEVKLQLLNGVNYLNQAYYGVEYNPDKELHEKATFRSYDVLNFEDVEVKGAVVTEVLENTANNFEVLMTFEIDKEDLISKFKERGLVEDDGPISFTEELRISFDPKTFWVKEYQEFLSIETSEFKFIQSSSTVIE
ncbi:hypothetical protein [Halocola ammonii]